MSDDAKLSPEQEALAETGSFVLAGRHSRIETAYAALQGAAFEKATAEVREALAAFGIAASGDRPLSPAASLRGRILATLAARRSRTALLVIDMINDHLEPGGPLEVPRARAVVTALSARLDRARKDGTPVVYIMDEHDPDDEDLEEWGTHALKGSKGAEVWEPLAPKPGDRVVAKASYSAFFETGLAAVLDELKVDSLVLTGCLTEIGIMATATDALQRGFAIDVPPDSQAGAAEELEKAAMGTMAVMAPFGPARKKLLERLAA